MITMEDVMVSDWNGEEVRFVRYEGEWWAVLKDVCDILGLKTWHVKDRIQSWHLTKAVVPVSDLGSNEVRSRGCNASRLLILVDEPGIYQAIMGSRKVEAIKFGDWLSLVLCDLRRNAGYESYDAMRVMDRDVQKRITAAMPCAEYMEYDDEEERWYLVRLDERGNPIDH